MGLDESNARRRLELTNKEKVPTEGSLHKKKYLTDVFGYAEHRQKCSYGLGYKLTK